MQDFAQWIDFLQSVSSETLALSVQISVMWISILLAVRILNCLCKALHSGFLFWNLVVERLCVACARICTVDYCYVVGKDVVLSEQVFVKCFTVLWSYCGDTPVLSARGLCCGHALVFYAQDFSHWITTLQSGRNEAHVLSMRSLCFGDALTLYVQGFV